MASSKRSKLVLRADGGRSKARERVAFAGTFRIGGRPEQEVQIADVSPDGCRLLGSAVGVTKGEAVEVRMGSIGPITARLKWAKGGSIGVAFDAPLSSGEMARLDEEEPLATVIPMRRREP